MPQKIYLEIHVSLEKLICDTSKRKTFQTKFTFIAFLWNLINHWSGEDEVSHKSVEEEIDTTFLIVNNLTNTV